MQPAHPQSICMRMTAAWPAANGAMVKLCSAAHIQGSSRRVIACSTDVSVMASNELQQATAGMTQQQQRTCRVSAVTLSSPRSVLLMPPCTPMMSPISRLAFKPL